VSASSTARAEHEAQLSSRPETAPFDALRKLQSAISNGFIHRWAVRRIPPDAFVLDAACGDGRLGRLRPKGDYVGFDFVERLARRAKRFTGKEIAVGDVQALGVRSACVDVVTCFEVLEHLDDPSAALAEFTRVLRPGGQLFLSVPNDDGLKHRLKRDPHPLHHGDMDLERVVSLVNEQFEIELVSLRGFWFFTPGPVSVQAGLPGPRWLATNILISARKAR
jgi:2-polyprenyl-3-methyl-5-hydroxy-6-metoxy-1,4-benzoquinol methylase